MGIEDNGVGWDCGPLLHRIAALTAPASGLARAPQRAGCRASGHGAMIAPGTDIDALLDIFWIVRSVDLGRAHFCRLAEIRLART